MENTPKTKNHIRSDLAYISLLLDDRKRGFYNNPIAPKQDDGAFLTKLATELSESLPKNTQETQSLFPTLSPTHASVQAETIYVLVIKEELLQDFPEQSSTIRELPLKEATEELGSLRAIESRLDLGMREAIAIQKISSLASIRDFSLDDAQANLLAIKTAKAYLKDTHSYELDPVTKALSLPTSHQ